MADGSDEPLGSEAKLRAQLADVRKDLKACREQNESLKSRVTILGAMAKRYRVLWKCVAAGHGAPLLKACSEQVAIAQVNTVMVLAEGREIRKVSLPAMVLTFTEELGAHA